MLACLLFVNVWFRILRGHQSEKINDDREIDSVKSHIPPSAPKVKEGHKQ